MVHAHPNRQAAQANAPREEAGGEARAHHVAGSKEGEGGADSLPHWLDYQLQEVKSRMLGVLRRGSRVWRGIRTIECTTTVHGRRTWDWNQNVHWMYIYTEDSQRSLC
jgi:hypothetical protein